MKEIMIVSALIERKGKFLILKRSEKCRTNKLRWQLPEGKVKSGETLLEALKRELKEETNLDLVDARFFNEFSSVVEFNGEKYKLIRKIFRCEVSGDIKLSSEHLTYKWIEPKEAEKFKWFEGFEPWRFFS